MDLESKILKDSCVEFAWNIKLLGIWHAQLPFSNSGEMWFTSLEMKITLSTLSESECGSKYFGHTNVFDIIVI